MNEPATYSSGHLSVYAVDRLAEAVGPPEERAQAEQHLTACAACTELLTKAKHDRQRFAQRMLAPTLATTLERRRRGRLRWLWSLALVPVAAAALFFVVPGQIESDLRAKGEAPVLRVVAERGGEIFKVARDQPLREGDRIRFMADPNGERFVLVAGVDGAGHVNVYVPFDGTESLAIAPDREFVSPDAVRLDATPGPERVFALFSRDPLSAKAIAPTLEAIGKQGAAAIRATELLPGAAVGGADLQLSFLWEKTQ